ncbi:uncharacterized protein LOC111617077 [Centruroides sculpturatus]|uniref:uncharacterized protein LOC111617077 n=1 Tax=Centruroides sculpturatus TaxID=218467 RepID=UPI000C6D6945|nr:uncharacterized protein LOC111617077 [Centruroides sculpturatus]
MTDEAHESNIIIYTDGSKINSYVGCAFVAYAQNQEIYSQVFRLGELSTIFQAEMFAILMAVTWTNDTYNDCYITIISDSASSLATLHNNELHPISTKIKHVVCTSNNMYTFQWTMAHHGTVGNERADFLAKTAASNTCLPVSYNKISMNVVKRILWLELINEWQGRWNECEGSNTYRFLPSIEETYKFKWIKPNHWITQFLTNHGKFASYFARFSGLNTNLCPICQIEDGNVHYIFHCPILERERNEIQNILHQQGISWPCDLPNLINTKENFFYFNNLTKRYGKLTTIRA